MTVDRHNLNILFKANKILNIILIALIVILVRVWHLAVIQYDEKLKESRKPQHKVILEPAKRATIRDRFNLPLALNKIQYNAAVLYAPLKQIPSIGWEKGPDGARVRKFKRREYIYRLSQVLAKELDLDAGRVVDLIHAKASLYYNLPFVIKEDISEREYYRLKFLENEMPGIQVQRLPKRYYPRGKVGADIIGYMGAINRQEYETILEEIQTLEIFLKECDEGVSPELPGGVLTQAQAKKRLKDLQEHAYSINDYVGKAGIERKCEQILRGYHGKKVYYADAKGNFLHELPGTRPPLSGQRLLLTISAELQEYAEKLLAQNERIREPRANTPDAAKLLLTGLRQPWIKGGSILAMDPKTGEVLAMASYPRHDPNDFIASGNAEENRRKGLNIARWFESEAYLAAIWDQKLPLERELYDDRAEEFFDDSIRMTWKKYLHFILPKKNPIILQLEKSDKIGHAIELQKAVDRLLSLSCEWDLYYILNTLYKNEGHIPYKSRISEEAKEAVDESLKIHAEEVVKIKAKLDRCLAGIPENYDKVLFIDLNRMAVKSDLFSKNLIAKFGKITLSDYRDASASKAILEEAVKKMSKKLFRQNYFQAWKNENEKGFLKEKRAAEKAAKQYPKPYIDYLDSKEEELFKTFWDQNQWTLLLALLQKHRTQDESLGPYISYFHSLNEELSAGLHAEVPWRPAYECLSNLLNLVEPSLAEDYLKTMRSFDELSRPLYGRYRHLRKEQGVQLEKHLAAAFYPAKGFGYGRSQAYREAAPQGSIFKLVTAYAALVQRFHELGEKAATPSNLNPFEMTDHTHRQGKDTYIGYHADGKPIPRAYRGGKLPRSIRPYGKMDLLKAIETSSNPYFSIIAGDILHSPEDLAKAARLFSYGNRTGIDLPAEIKGKIPDDLNENRTGLYSMAIGQHSLVVTPMQTAVMLSTLANGGFVLKPKIINFAAGKKPVRNDETDNFPFRNSLAMAGIDFPLFSPDIQEQRETLVTPYPAVVKSEIFMPPVIRKILLDGMQRVVYRTQEESIAALSRFYRNYPEAIGDYLDLKEDLVGKTSTAEVVENLDLDLHSGTNLYTHVWFGGISFNRNEGSSQKIIFNDKFGEPELVVVVYLCYGAYGKEAAPIAAQIVQKWRDIKQRYGNL